MNAPSTPITIDTPIHTVIDNGDRLAGFIRAGNTTRAILLPPKAARHHPSAAWNKSRDRVTGALSFHDGQANTKAMAEAGSAIAQLALERGLYIPARDELDVIYRAFKPGSDDNWGYRSGDNPSSVPPGYPHEPKKPAQCALGEHRAGGAEAIPEEWVWSSTQYAGLGASAWCQDFRGGTQDIYPEYCELAVVLVRSVILR
jgi:hypothetical protein